MTNQPNRSEQVGTTKAKATKDWLSRQTKDPVEHAILGSFDFGYAVKHPIKSTAWAFGFAMSVLMVLSVLIGAFHLAFGRPGSIAFDWQKPTTWVAGAVDVIRGPVSGVLGGASDRVRGNGSGDGRYDPNSFED